MPCAFKWAGVASLMKDHELAGTSIYRIQRFEIILLQAAGGTRARTLKLGGPLRLWAVFFRSLLFFRFQLSFLPFSSVLYWALCSNSF